jgi:hypothetical protein
LSELSQLSFSQKFASVDKAVHAHILDKFSLV